MVYHKEVFLSAFEAVSNWKPESYSKLEPVSVTESES